MSRPLLTIGMIFRNDIRSLERSLEALCPLREAIPSELVMADTGSTDGSRAIAARYADVLFDFPWVDDFSAARNAVIQRSQGTWFLTVDSDEYLDRDLSELLAFFASDAARNQDVCTVVQRSYSTLEMNDTYTDFPAVRMARLDSGLRYQGMIHEQWVPLEGRQILSLTHTVLHHDGYVNMDGEHGQAKRVRNLSLLQKKLEKNPEDLMALLQCIESSRNLPEHLPYIRRTMALIEAKKPEWQHIGPPVFRHAVRAAVDNKLPELEEWIAQAEAWFPDSLFTRIDVAYFAFAHCWEKRDYAGCVRWGEMCLEAVARYREGGVREISQLYSAILMLDPYWERGLKIPLANAWLNEGDPGRGWALLEDLEYTCLDDSQVSNFVQVLREFQSRTSIDTAPLLTRFYRQIAAHIPTDEAGEGRQRALIQEGSVLFSPAYRQSEIQKAGFCRSAYTMFLPLADQCELGIAAMALETNRHDELEALLNKVTNWDLLPAAALEHALQAGVQFPLPTNPLRIETLHALAERLSRGGSLLIDFAIAAADDLTGNWQVSIWTHELAAAAVQTYDWTDTERGMALCRAYANVESTLLPRYYVQELLCEENVAAVPPLHRFGWYCAQAFAALDAGEFSGYVRLLRKGLETCKDMKPMVEFLVEHTPELQAPPPSEELRTLAEQVRAVLAQFPPDSPAVLALKQSEAYRQVAQLIEGEVGGRKAVKVVILAGGLGTRISEESYLKPKPMITIGEQPILWHIMKYYSSFGFHDFIICCGYKGHVIKEYFADYYLHRSDVTFDFSAKNRMTVHQNVAEPWRVTLVDTGLNTQTGARVKRVQKYIGNERFLLTYGDGVSNVDLGALLAQHESSGKVVTLTGIQPGGRFGVLDLDESGTTVKGFREKAKEDGGWINGGFMVMEPEAFDYLSAEEGCVLERVPLETLAREGKLGIYKHSGFWQCMDTQRDRGLLEYLWNDKHAPWKIWEEQRGAN